MRHKSTSPPLSATATRHAYTLKNGMKTPPSLHILLSCSLVRLGGCVRTVQHIRHTTVLPLSFDGPDTTHRVGRRCRPTRRLLVTMSSSANNNALEDAKAFNTYASAAVDLSNAHVSEAGLLTGECWRTRMCEI